VVYGDHIHCSSPSIFGEPVKSVSFWPVSLWNVARRSFPDEPHHHNDDQENQPDGQQAELDLGQQVGKPHQPVNPTRVRSFSKFSPMQIIVLLPYEVQ
jgi:hypothetical protein